MEQGIDTKKRRFHFPAAAIWVAAILLVGAATWLLLINNKHSEKALIADTNAVMGKTILLKLSSGQTITLSNNADSTYLVNGLQLKSTDKTLTFPESVNASSGMNRLIVPIGLDYKVRLSDGTIVYLNSATVLSFPIRFSGQTREISINGEAFLQVAKDATHPFIVNLPHGSVKVLGTEFNVNSYDSGVVKVALVRGAVNMQVNNRTINLTPGQEGVYKDDKLQARPFDEQTTLGWRQGIYYFDDATLKQITSVLPRWFGMPVQMDNKQMADQRFTGRVYRNAPITKFLDALKATTAVDYYIRDSVVHFR